MATCQSAVRFVRFMFLANSTPLLPSIANVLFPTNGFHPLNFLSPSIPLPPFPPCPSHLRSLPLLVVSISLRFRTKYFCHLSHSNFSHVIPNRVSQRFRSSFFDRWNRIFVWNNSKSEIIAVPSVSVGPTASRLKGDSNSTPLFLPLLFTISNIPRSYMPKLGRRYLQHYMLTVRSPSMC